MKLDLLMTIHVDISNPLEVGEGPFGKRQIYAVTGGTFDGDRLHGEVLPGGADWVLFDADGVARLDVRLTLRTDDDALIFVRYPGILVINERFSEAIQQGRMSEFDETHLLTQPLFETGDLRYAWLNRVVGIAEGRASQSAVEHRVYEAIPG